MTTKDLVLNQLKKKRGQWVSGESLSRSLAMSRSAVWKHIRALRHEGYGIESSPGNGYALNALPSILLPVEISDLLETGYMGRKKIVHFEKTDSTNMRAKELAAGGVPEGTLVVAESQTRGRGRKGRMWLSPPGDGIYASFIIRPPMPPAEASTITLLTAVAVAETLLTVTGLDVHIKWPNDIMIGPRKVAGILTEISTELDLINYVVLGLGLNVNTARFPDEIKDRATSLFLETRSSFSRAPILAGFLKRFEIYYEDAKTHGFGAVLTRWKELSATIGKKITVEMVDAVRAGTVRDLDDHGALMIEDEDGMVHRIVSGDVTMTS